MIANEMGEVRIKGPHRIDVPDKKGNLFKAILEIKYRLQVLPPINKKRRYPELTLTVIHARERDAARAGEDRLGIDHGPAGELPLDQGTL